MEVFISFVAGVLFGSVITLIKVTANEIYNINSDPDSVYYLRANRIRAARETLKEVK